MTASNPPDDDPFAEFDDWLVDGPAGKWPSEGQDDLTEYQRNLVRANTELLLDGEAWTTKMRRFEYCLSKIPSEIDKSEVRIKYCIRFDRFAFDDFTLPIRVPICPISLSFRHVNFVNCHFSFYATKFSCSFVDFFGVNVIGGSLGFHKCNFLCDRLIFDHVKFNHTIFSWSDCTFCRSGPESTSGEFTNTHFYMYGSQFKKGGMRLWSCLFSKGHLSCSGCSFNEGGIGLPQCSFVETPCIVDRALIRGAFNANGAHFEYARFRDTKFESSADFNGAKFTTIPNMRHSSFDRSPEVSGMVLPAPVLARPVPEIETDLHGLKRWLSYVFSFASDPCDVLKLRKLKAMAIAANDHEKDGDFFAYEMVAKRGVEHTMFWQLLFNTIYWKVSFYGQSYLRPLGWLSASFATFASIYTLMAALPIGGWSSLFFGITFSFKNSLPFLGTLTRSVPSPEGHVSWFAHQLETLKGAQIGPDWFTVLGTGQAMLSLFFFFFLLLGLRNKFRLK